MAYSPPKSKPTTYEDILQKMGMVVVNGQLVTLPVAAAVTPSSAGAGGTGGGANAAANSGNVAHSYIYNKYFREHANGLDGGGAAASATPHTPEELRDHLLRQIAQQQRIRQIKPKRMSFY